MSETLHAASSTSAPPASNYPRSTPPMSITGAGAVTGYGWGRKRIWDGFLLGESAVKPVPALATYLDSPPYLATITGSGDIRDGKSRFTQALRFSAREAIVDAQERGWSPGPVVGVIHSLALGDVETYRDYYRQEGDFSGRRKLRSWLHMIPSTVIAMFMKEFDFHGPAMSVSATCASSNVGMLTAKSWIDSGIASDVILLATDLSGIAENIPWFRGPRRGCPRSPRLRRVPSLSGGQPRFRRGRSLGGHGAVQSPGRCLRLGARGRDDQ